MQKCNSSPQQCNRSMQTNGLFPFEPWSPEKNPGAAAGQSELHTMCCCNTGSATERSALRTSSLGRQRACEQPRLNVQNLQCRLNHSALSCISAWLCVRQMYIDVHCCTVTNGPYRMDTFEFERKQAVGLH